ncbi:MAG: hypothetical protein JSU92_11620 [Deltaproteobacteria bacterium]|nr:MAG: hypothetical protein JSU92_11620 [Deltaproteobacteria bacterium]
MLRKLTVIGLIIIWGGILGCSKKGAVTEEYPLGKFLLLGLEGEEVREVLFHPSDSNTIYVATSSSGVFKSTDGGVSFTASNDGLPDRDAITLALDPFKPSTLYVGLEGNGIFKSSDGGVSWIESNEGFVLPSFPGINLRLDMPFVKKLVADPLNSGVVYAATLGGVYRSTDYGGHWQNISISGGAVNPLTLSLAIDPSGPSQLYGGFGDLSSLVPPEYTEFIQGVFFKSSDGGNSWELSDEGLVAKMVTALSLDPSEPSIVYAGSLGDGVFKSTDSGVTWQPINNGLLEKHIISLNIDPKRPSTILAGMAGGELFVSKDSGKSWLESPGGVNGNIPLCFTFHPEDSRVLIGTYRGGLFVNSPREEGEKSDVPEQDPNRRVYLALSHHVSLYHSYRGDTNDNDGFGLDITVIRNTLDFLDEYPQVHADWDCDNIFTTGDSPDLPNYEPTTIEDILPTYAPDIIERIGERVRSGKDGLRLMSWNNGMTGAETREEFVASILRAMDSYQYIFGTFDPGINPQEDMLSPDQIGLLRDLGIDWITLFYSASPFTAFRRDVELNIDQQYNPLTFRGPEDDAGIILVPAYHHADIIDHGGLKAWVEFIYSHASMDTLLLIHFDADAESWLGFSREIDGLEDAGLPYLSYTTIQDYLNFHCPVGEVILYKDLADGLFDGYNNWAEKEINHRIWTNVEASRSYEQKARLLIEGLSPSIEKDVILGLLTNAFEYRMRALSTTHFGLAQPYLCDQRRERAISIGDKARDNALTAFDEAVSLQPTKSPDTQVIFNQNPSDSLSLIGITVTFPQGSVLPGDLVGVKDYSGQELPSDLTDVVTHVDGSLKSATLNFIMELGAGAGEAVTFITSTTVSYGCPVGADTRVLTNGIITLTLNPVTGYPDSLIFDGEEYGMPGFIRPFITYQGVEYSPEGFNVEVINSGTRGYMATIELSGKIILPNGARTSTIAYRFTVIEDLPYLFAEVDIDYADTEVEVDDGWEEVAPFGISPSLSSSTLKVWRRNFTGYIGSYPVSREEVSLNNQVTDGWVALSQGEKGVLVGFNSDVLASPAFCPIRFPRFEEKLRAVLNPFGTFYGEQPDYFSWATGGIGLGKEATQLIGSHFASAAINYNGKTERFSLIVAPYRGDRPPDDLIRDMVGLAHPFGMY